MFYVLHCPPHSFSSLADKFFKIGIFIKKYNRMAIKFNGIAHFVLFCIYVDIWGPKITKSIDGMGKMERLFKAIFAVKCDLFEFCAQKFWEVVSALEALLKCSCSAHNTYQIVKNALKWVTTGLLACHEWRICRDFTKFHIAPILIELISKKHFYPLSGA